MSNPEPPKLDYFAPTDEKPKTSPFGKLVGFLGFGLYGLLAALFDVQTIFMVFRARLHAPRAAVSISGVIGAFCTWRAIAAFKQLIR